MCTRKAAEPVTINGHTLEQVVARYLAELANPAPDYGMRNIYRKWMGEFVGQPAGDDRNGGDRWP